MSRRKEIYLREKLRSEVMNIEDHDNEKVLVYCPRCSFYLPDIDKMPIHLEVEVYINKLNDIGYELIESIKSKIEELEEFKNNLSIK